MYVDKSKQPHCGNESDNANFSQSTTQSIFSPPILATIQNREGSWRRPAINETYDVQDVLEMGNGYYTSNISQSMTQRLTSPQRLATRQNREGSWRRPAINETYVPRVLQTVYGNESDKRLATTRQNREGSWRRPVINETYVPMSLQTDCGNESNNSNSSQSTTQSLTSPQRSTTRQNREGSWRRQAINETYVPRVLQMELGTSNEESQKKYTIDPPNENIDLHEEKTETTTLPEKYFSLKAAIDLYQQRHIFPQNDNKVFIHEEQFVMSKSLQNHQICSKCLNYLSVEPVTTINRQKICGRKSCYNAQYNKSLYNRIVEKYLFNCINQFNGCQAVLPYTEEMTQHEIVCSYAKKHTCMKCKFQGNGCQIIQHYKISHSNIVTQHGVFKLELKDRILNENLVFPIDNDMILINIEIYNNKLDIFYEHLNASNKLQYLLIIFQPKSNFEYVSTLTDFKSKTIDLSEMKIFFSSQIVFGAVRLHIQNPLQKLVTLKIPDNFYINYLKNIMNLLLRLKISCSSCKTYIEDKTAVVFCPEIHVYCIHCIRQTKNYCRFCNINCSLTDLKTIFTGYKIPCDWKLCTKQIDCVDFFIHKQVCCNREYTCPVNGCSFVGNKEELATHWHSPIPLVFGESLNLILKTNEEYFWIIDYIHELLHIKIDENITDYEIKVNEKYIMFPNNYKLELIQNLNNSSWPRKIDPIQNGNTKTYFYNVQSHNDVTFIVQNKKKILVENISEDEKIINNQHEVLLKRLMSILFRVNPKCCMCSNLINDKAEIYISAEGYIRCNRCTNNNIEFLRLNDLLKDLKFSCDWPGCKEISTCWDFLFHKQICQKRLYVYFDSFTHNHFTKDDLQRYRGDEVTVGIHLEFKTSASNKKMYWLTAYVNELLIVNVDYNSKVGLIVCEKHAIFPNNYKLELDEFNTNKNYYEIVTELKQAGDNKSYNNRLKWNTNYRLTIKVIHNHMTLSQFQS